MTRYIERSDGSLQPELPGVLAEIAEIAGWAAAALVALARGGTRAYIPTPERLTPEHWLVQAVGQDAALAICERFRGELVEIPLGPWAGCRNQVAAAIRRGLAQGKPASQIAREVGVTERTVTNHKRGHKQAHKRGTTGSMQQLSLFS